MDKAVGIKYTRYLPAPFVVAKGKGEIARRIMSIAEEHNISVYKDDILAENLIEIEVGSFIPEKYYEIIAEVLVFVGGIR